MSRAIIHTVARAIIHRVARAVTLYEPWIPYMNHEGGGRRGASRERNTTFYGRYTIPAAMDCCCWRGTPPRRGALAYRRPLDNAHYPLGDTLAVLPTLPYQLCPTNTAH